MEKFVAKLRTILPTGSRMTIEEGRKVIKEINEFLYTNYEGIETTIALNAEMEYFSDFHKYWHMNHSEILDITIDEDKCREVAIALHEVYVRTRGKAFREVYDTKELSKSDICRIRLLTANQDFRGSLDFGKLITVFNSDKSTFDEKVILDDPQSFLKEIGVSLRSQGDKRAQYAMNICKYLIEKNIEPYELIEYFDRDVFALRNSIIEESNAGYGNKKADMFIRDMVVLNVWSNVKGFDKIDVASDVNTIKVALRTGILKTAIPLVSSFLDIFCYQYGYVDTMNASAWRKVWEVWCELYPKDEIESPSLLDFFIYNVVGKQFCRESLAEYKCDVEDHTFKWHTGMNKRCQICYSKGIANIKATRQRMILPCTDDEGYIAINNTDFVKSKIAEPNYDECPFKNICTQTDSFFLRPPKSISIKGRTGWETAYTRKNEGGGGLMS